MTALPAVGRKRVPATVLVGSEPASDGVIVQIQKFRNLRATLSIVEQQDRIRTPRDAVILSVAAHA